MTRRRDASLPHESVTRYVVEVGRAFLRKRMKDRAVKRADLDRRLAEEWFPIDEQAWRDCAWNGSNK